MVLRDLNISISQGMRQDYDAIKIQFFDANFSCRICVDYKWRNSDRYILYVSKFQKYIELTEDWHCT
jgi:hypothetical protein